MKGLNLEIAYWGILIISNVWLAVGNTLLGVFYLVLAAVIFIMQISHKKHGNETS